MTAGGGKWDESEANRKALFPQRGVFSPRFPRGKGRPEPLHAAHLEAPVLLRRETPEPATCQGGCGEHSGGISHQTEKKQFNERHR